MLTPHHKWLTKCAYKLISISLPICLLSISLTTLQTNESFYHLLQKQVVATDQANSATYRSATDNVAEFLKHQTYLNQQLFSLQARQHLNDVRYLLDLNQNITRASFIIFSIRGWYLWRDKTKQTKIISCIRYGSLITLGLCGLILLMGLFNFTELFVQFHQLIFTNQLWLFSETDLLVNIFPEQFFTYFMMSWLFLASLLSVSILLITDKINRR